MKRVAFAQNELTSRRTIMTTKHKIRYTRGHSARDGMIVAFFFRAIPGSFLLIGVAKQKEAKEIRPMTRSNPMPITSARKLTAKVAHKVRPLLGSSHKTELSLSVGTLTGVLYLAPADESGFNVCQFATAGCKAACLGHSSGKMVFPTHKLSRVRKTLMYFRDRPGFFAQLRTDIARLARKAAKKGLIPSVRLNGASDLPWEKSGIFEAFPNVVFYDYTKSRARALASLLPGWPANYRLTFSRSGENDTSCDEVLAAGGNVAVVFSHKTAKPSQWHGYPVIDGDAHDYRFSDPRGVVVGLKAKGKGRSDASGFVIW